MKLSTNFVKDYVDIDVDVKTLAENMTRIGNEYDSAEKLITATNLIIGQIIKCELHPDSDHLHICKVDVKNEVIDIVCGAPNARKGIKVIVALPGANLPGGVTIKKGTIRGIESNGMMCSLAELGIEQKFLSADDKEGICELGEDSIIGEDPIEYLGLNDSVIDFELTANRGDLLSILGMAYEIGAIYGKNIKDVDIMHQEIKETGNSLKLEIQTKNCKLFIAKKAKNLTIKESPDFIKNRLIASGIRPINNVVDISNYVMLELGQPLHFYDQDKLENKIIVRMAKNGERLTTLDGNERILDEEDIVIATEQKVIGLAGVMGGLDTEVVENTRNIIIESAIFDSVMVRKTSKKSVRSEASNRFEKGLDPNRTYMAIERACNLLEKYADAKIISGIVVYDKTEKSDKKIEIEVDDINRVLGTELTEDEVIDVFKKLKFSGYAEDGYIKVSVPTRRLDINIKEDLIEEVGRIYGVDNILGKLPILPMKKGTFNRLTREIRNKMISLGLNETLTYILVNEKEAKQFTNEEFEPLKLLDPMSEDRNTLRYSIIPSLMKTYKYNVVHDVKDVSIFELGKGFYKKGEKYGEDQKLCALMSGKYFEGLSIENVSGAKKPLDFFVLKGIVEEILDYLGYKNRYSFVIPKEIPLEFHPGQVAEISVNNDIVGVIGAVHPSITNEISKQSVYVMEINLDKLLEKRVGTMKFKDISKFPNVKKDLAFTVNKNISAKQISDIILKAGGSLLTNIEVFDVYTGENVEKGKKSIAFSLTFNDNKKTLNDEEINQIFNKIIDTVEIKCGAELRGI
ncbi:MAG TPA: phenylalanine--tRNA ligase subunit beta [Clostridia bacterium]|nr:phenylalanine--tRNA ligase subunit beta [Clostridia bacterium]